MAKSKLKIVDEVHDQPVDGDEIKGKMTVYARLRQAHEASAEVVTDYTKGLKEDGLDVPAFKLVYRLSKMDRAKAKDFLASFDSYRAIVLADVESDLFNEGDAKPATKPAAKAAEAPADEPAPHPLF